jgi:hypothetical protein
LVCRLSGCADKEKNLSHAGIKPCVSDPESVIPAGSYTYREYISPIKFLKFLIANNNTKKLEGEWKAPCIREKWTR